MSFAVRFTRIAPESPDELREAILEDLEALSPGMRCVATRVPVAGRGVIDLFASDERGRLAVVSFCLDADPGAVAHTVDQWDWTMTNMGLLRALVPVVGLDLTLSPRAILVCQSIGENVRRFAACLPTPGIEIFEATMVAAGERRGLLVDRITSHPPAVVRTGSAIDSALEGIASDETRALTRRLFEELQETTVGGGPFTAVRLAGAFDIRRDGRDVATLAATSDGLAVRWIDAAHVMRVSDDDGCREAVRLLASPLDQSEPAMRTQARVAARGPATAALTAEEVAEFERLRSEPHTLRDTAAGAAPGLTTEPELAHPAENTRAETRHEADTRHAADTRHTSESPEPPAVRVLRTGFMEN